jgi:hypothetical protein
MWKMSEANKRLALRWLDAIWNGDLDAPAAGGVVEQLVHPDFYNHEAAADRPGGPDGFRDTARRLRHAFASSPRVSRRVECRSRVQATGAMSPTSIAVVQQSTVGRGAIRRHTMGVVT